MEHSKTSYNAIKRNIISCTSCMITDNFLGISWDYPPSTARLDCLGILLLLLPHALRDTFTLAGRLDCLENLEMSKRGTRRDSRLLRHAVYHIIIMMK